MSIRFNSEKFMRDFEVAGNRKKISIHRASVRSEIEPSTIYGLRNGNIKEITVTTLARMLDFMGETDIGKYIYDDSIKRNLIQENGQNV